MATKPRIAKGTRDFNSQQIANREYIFNTIKSQFKTFGFAPIETPSFELSETLLDKYGEEGDRLIFKILNSGDKVKKADIKALEEGNLTRFSNSLSEKALRYDLTVPFARYVAQYQNEIIFPFKRYQIQPVWRADRPQKGRFQEFFQCDADVVGSNSLWQEVEFIQLYDAIFSDLKLEGVTIKINNRKILAAIAERIGAQDKLIDFTVALDKLDKIGTEKVKEEMLQKGIPKDGIKTLEPLFDMKGDFQEQLNALKLLLGTSEVGSVGISELEFISNTINNLELKTAMLKLDLTLARGLNYYTGAIFEVSAPDGVSMGSIGGGGRYDDLTSIFGLKGISGVGISFGLDRIALVMEELNLFPKNNKQTTTILFTNFGKKESLYCYKVIQSLRATGIVAELYPDNTKLKKQITYANKRNIPFVVIVGEEEMKANTFTLKNMTTGIQESVDFMSLKSKFKE
jgi:histidyl-tRNA synthetase